MADLTSRFNELSARHSGNDSSLASALGVSKQTISAWRTGVRSPKKPHIVAIAKYFNVSIPWLMGLTDDENYSESLPSNIVSVALKKIPLLGGIAAGEPILADQEYDTYVEADSDVRCDFALRVDGDSMQPTIMYGDLVFIRRQDGEIAAVLLDNEATLKRVYHIPNGVQLISDNTKYPARLETWPDRSTIRILGKAVAYKRIL